MIVKNWREVYKSFAVWFSVLGTIIYQASLTLLDAGTIPPDLEPIVAGVSGALGWIISQPYIKKQREV